MDSFLLQKYQSMTFPSKTDKIPLTVTSWKVSVLKFYLNSITNPNSQGCLHSAFSPSIMFISLSFVDRCLFFFFHFVFCRVISLTFNHLPFSFPFAYCGGLFLSMLLKLWLLRFKLEAPWTLVLLPAAGTLEGPGSLEWYNQKLVRCMQCNT